MAATKYARKSQDVLQTLKVPTDKMGFQFLIAFHLPSILKVLCNFVRPFIHGWNTVLMCVLVVHFLHEWFN